MRISLPCLSGYVKTGWAERCWVSFPGSSAVLCDFPRTGGRTVGHCAGWADWCSQDCWRWAQPACCWCAMPLPFPPIAACVMVMLCLSFKSIRYILKSDKPLSGRRVCYPNNEVTLGIKMVKWFQPGQGRGPLGWWVVAIHIGPLHLQAESLTTQGSAGTGVPGGSSPYLHTTSAPWIKAKAHHCGITPAVES